MVSKTVAYNDYESLVTIIILDLFRRLTLATNLDRAATIFLCRKKTNGFALYTVCFLLFFVAQRYVPKKKYRSSARASTLVLLSPSFIQYFACRRRMQVGKLFHSWPVGMSLART